MITLYQMPVSHYCEKVRWALAYKRLPVRERNLLPGLHSRVMKKLTGQSSVPVIKDDRNIVFNSSDIITYLDEEYPRFFLTPEDAGLAQQALHWESWADQEIGPSVRVLVYKHLIDRPDVLMPMFAQRGPWYSKFYLNKAYPKIRESLIHRMKLDDADVELVAMQTLTAAKEHLLTHITHHERLVAGGFSRADLAVAALLAPLFQPSKYGVIWPNNMPEGLREVSEQFAELRPWLEFTYQTYR